MERPGVVDVRDLASRYAWQELAVSSFVAAAGLALDGPTRRSFAPPRVLVLVAPHDRPWMVARARAWLADAEHVVVVRDRREELAGAPAEDVADLAELAAMLEPEWREALRGLSVEVVDWVAATDAACGEAIERALAACRRLAPREPTVVDGDRDAMERPREAPTLPVSPWCELVRDASWAVPSDLAARLAWRGGAVVLLVDHAGGESVTLAHGLPPRLSLLGAPPGKHVARDATRAHPGWEALGLDPVHPVAWRGDRMTVHWSYVARDGERCFLSATDHDFPCGPAKKLYGFEDNDPAQITLAPDATVFAAHFAHDVLVTSAVPVPWQTATHAGGEVEVAAFPVDPRRAVFFAQRTDGSAPRPPDIDVLDEDARDVAPALVLGPTDAARYALALDLRVVRIMSTGEPGSAEAIHVGGPGEDYAVFDACHRLVRRGRGRLLGGWFRWATVEHDDAYWREDIATGERVRVAPVDLAFAEDAGVEAVARDAVLEGRYEHALELHRRHASRVIDRDVRAVAVPGTRNVLLVSAHHVRVI